MPISKGYGRVGTSSLKVTDIFGRQHTLTTDSHLAGVEWGGIVVQDFGWKGSGGENVWEVECFCGETFYALQADIKKRSFTTCGCLGDTVVKRRPPRKRMAAIKAKEQPVIDVKAVTVEPKPAKKAAVTNHHEHTAKFARGAAVIISSEKQSREGSLSTVIEFNLGARGVVEEIHEIDGLFYYKVVVENDIGLSVNGRPVTISGSGHFQLVLAEEGQLQQLA